MLTILKTTFSMTYSRVKKNECFSSQVKFHGSWFLRVQSTDSKPALVQMKLWLAAWQVSNHYLNQQWPNLITDICITQPQITFFANSTVTDADTSIHSGCVVVSCPREFLGVLLQPFHQWLACLTEPDGLACAEVRNFRPMWGHADLETHLTKELVIQIS